MSEGILIHHASALTEQDNRNMRVLLFHNLSVSFGISHKASQARVINPKGKKLILLKFLLRCVHSVLTYCPSYLDWKYMVISTWNMESA